MGANAVKNFGEAGGAVGRGARAEWQLPDPNRLVSSEHFKVSFRDGSFILTDLSVNGTFLNHSEKPIGKELSVKLRDGDTIVIGDYTIAVAIVGDAPAVAAAVGLFDDFLDNRHKAADGEPSLGSTIPSIGGAKRDDLILEELDPLELLGGDARRSAPIRLPGAESDHSPITEDFLNVPAPAGSSIPDDWNPLEEDDLIVAPARSVGQATVHKLAARAPAAASSSADDAAPRVDITTPSGGLLLEAFLRGSEVGPEALGDLPPAEFMEIVGRLFSIVLTDTRALLMARASVKAGFRLDLTMIQPRENNPLKFTVGDTEDIMRNLFNRRASGYLRAEEAFEEAFRDIKDHQLGVIAGMRATFEGLLARFEPAAIETDSTRGGGPLAMIKKARNWEAYCLLHEKLVKDAQDDSELLFGPDFADAYKKQVRDS